VRDSVGALDARFYEEVAQNDRNILCIPCMSRSFALDGAC